MRRLLKVAGLAICTLLVVAGVGVSWLSARSPNMRPPSTEKVEATPERLARGKYLMTNLVDCMGCHSSHVDDRYAWPIKAGTEGQGGFIFDEKVGVPGTVAAQNLTSDPETGKGNWTDGELIRAIREGIGRDGHALFPMMPYEKLRHMSDEDARAIVAYMRTLKPVRNVIPPTNIKFPVNLLIKFQPQPADGPPETPKDDPNDPQKHLAYGKYVTTLAGCQECHTPHDGRQQPIAGKEFAGGWEMLGPWGRVRTANLTPHPDTFIGQATKEQFIARFKSFKDWNDETAPKAAKGMNTVMQWISYAGMTEEDLGAIFDYLKSQKPIKNDVIKFPDAPTKN